MNNAAKLLGILTLHIVPQGHGGGFLVCRVCGSVFSGYFLCIERVFVLFLCAPRVFWQIFFLDWFRISPVPLRRTVFVLDSYFRGSMDFQALGGQRTHNFQCLYVRIC